jgi:DNA-binding winged helix-turn-helix (wHTH) protein
MDRHARGRTSGKGEFALGATLVSPSLRTVTGPGGRALLEPRMMQVLAALSERPGELVTREELLATCWNGAPVGDDSLNRAVAGVRRAARRTGDDFSIETVSGAGYVLVAREPELGGNAPPPNSSEAAIAEGWRVWRLGLPAVNVGAIEGLRAAAQGAPERADVWGLLALLLRHAVEYADADTCAELVGECEAAAARAQALAPGQPEANAAMIGLWPIFGDWSRRRADLLATLEKSPGHAPLLHDLLVLEMSTGRPGTAIQYLEPLHAEDRLAAIYHYKLVYQYWTLGRLAEADRVADRAMQLWPRHPAIWFCRLWHLAFTGRPAQAAQQLADESNRPPIPLPALGTFQSTLDSLLDDSPELRANAVAANLAAAERGPAQCSHALIQLGGLGEVDAAFAVAQGYYLRSGPVTVSIRKTVSDPTVNEQHRRVTQPLFIPTAAAMRADPRFMPLCEAMGLGDYWQSAGIVPDFLA